MTRLPHSSTPTAPFRVHFRRVLRFCRQLDVVWRRVRVDSKNLNKTDFFLRCDGNSKQARLLLARQRGEDKIFVIFRRDSRLQQ